MRTTVATTLKRQILLSLDQHCFRKSTTLAALLDNRRKANSIALKSWLWSVFLMCFMAGWPGKGFAQIPFSYTQFTSEDGLPSSEVYKVVQDHHGYIWLATDRGLVRFNGQEFRTFTAADGLEDLTIFDLEVDERGRLWCVSYANRLWYWENNRFHLHCLSDTLMKQPSIVVDIGFEDTIVGVVLAHGQLLWSPMDCSSIQSHGPWEKRSEQLHLGGGPANLCAFQGLFRHSLPFDPKENFQWHPWKPEPTGDPSPFLEYRVTDCFAVRQGEEVVGHFGGTIFHWDGAEQWQLFQVSGKVNKAFHHDGKDWWVGTTNGLYRFAGNDFSQPIDHWLEGYNITAILCDREGGYWFTSQSNGVFYAANSNMRTFHAGHGLQNDRVNAVTSLGEHFFFGGVDGHLWSYRPGEDTTVLHYTSAISIYNAEALEQQQEVYFGVYLGSRYCPKSGKVEHIQPTFANAAFARHPIFTTSYVDKVTFQDVLEPSFQKWETIEVRALRKFAFLPQDTLMGGRFGLFRWKEKQLQPMVPAHPVFRHRVTDLLHLPDHTIIVGTLGGGVAVLRGTTLKTITESEGLINNNCQALHLDGQHQLWVATNAGLCRLTGWQIGETTEAVLLTQADGLPSNMVLDVHASDQWVAAATDQGIAFFENQRTELHPHAIPLYLTRLQINGGDTLLPDSFTLSAGQNNLEVFFEPVSFRYRKSLVYRYRLSSEADWSHTQSRDLVFNALAPGHYQLQIQAGDGSGWWSERPLQLTFEILPPLWARWWFVLLGSVGGVLLILLVFRWQLGVVRKRQALQLEIIANQNQALSSQLNPHLIYNSLNSVLAKALENDARALIGFVARFAQLLRSVFEMSEHKLVPLAQELQVLKAYLQLESLRHGEHLRYHFNWESDADVPLAYLPPLLLQPLVENAIKYGQIDPEQGRSCEVSVSVQVQEQRLLLTVTDNGPGMPKERQPDTDRPSGLGIVRKRLQLLEEWLKAKTEFNITTDPTGTSIQLVLPLLQKIPPS